MRVGGDYARTDQKHGLGLYKIMVFFTENVHVSDD